MKIELESYEHTCEDGCCYTTGYDVFVDGEKIGHTLGEDAYELVEMLNEHFDNDKEKDSIDANKHELVKFLNYLNEHLRLEVSERWVEDFIRYGKN